MDRRLFLACGLAIPFASTVRGQSGDPIYIGDMHFHSFFGPDLPHGRPVAKTLADGGATLVAWKQTGDGQWIQVTDRGYKQISVPLPGDTLRRFHRQFAQIKAHIAEQKLKIVRTAADVDLAMKGEPHIVLAVEGASFVDEVAHVKMAHDAGIRHLQLVHYIRNSLGDFQTEKPEHNGLTELGKKVVAECNRLGLLVDVAHCTPAAIKDVLAISKVPVVNSHGSIAAAAAKPNFSLVGWRARQLTFDDAKLITSKGGVIGLWALKPDVGPSAESYGARFLEMARQFGDDHVAFGTDINGLGTYASMNNYVDVRGVVDYWQKQKIAEKRIRKFAIENYARVLKAALN